MTSLSFAFLTHSHVAAFFFFFFTGDHHFSEQDYCFGESGLRSDFSAPRSPPPQHEHRHCTESRQTITNKWKITLFENRPGREKADNTDPALEN